MNSAWTELSGSKKSNRWIDLVYGVALSQTSEPRDTVGGRIGVAIISRASPLAQEIDDSPIVPRALEFSAHRKKTETNKGAIAMPNLDLVEFRFW